MKIVIPPKVWLAAKRIGNRFESKVDAWAKEVTEKGIVETRFRRRDHSLALGRWTTRLNHRYRLVYRVEQGSVFVEWFETHNKQTY